MSRVVKEMVSIETNKQKYFAAGATICQSQIIYKKKSEKMEQCNISTDSFHGYNFFHL